MGAKSPDQIVMQFYTVVDIWDGGTPAHFGSHQFGRFRMAGDRISGFSIDFQHRPYNTLALPCQRVMLYTICQSVQFAKCTVQFPKCARAVCIFLT